MHHGAGQVPVKPRDQLVEVGPQLGLLDAALELTDALGDARPQRGDAGKQKLLVKQMKRGY